MRPVLLAIAVVTLVAVPAARQHDQHKESGGVAIPQSIQSEHRAIHAELEAASRAKGRTGEAARALAEVLHPHFVREEEIALPPLGLLAPLAAGEQPPDAAAMLKMTDTLKQEMPRMLSDHKRIRAALDVLRTAARDERAAPQERFTAHLADHARTEEEVLYPAAILVGDVIRARMQKH